MSMYVCMYEGTSSSVGAVVSGVRGICRGTQHGQAATGHCGGRGGSHGVRRPAALVCMYVCMYGRVVLVYVLVYVW